MVSVPEQPNPSGVDPTLIQGALPTPEQISEIFYDFWRSDPTEVWRPYVDAANQSIDSGVPVTILSGAHGIGKSQIFGLMMLAHERGDVRVVGELGGQVLSTENFTRGRWLEKRVVLLDEAVSPHAERSHQYAKSIQNGINAGKQFFLTIPGPSATSRQRSVEANTQALSEVGIVEVKNLGDVNNVHVTAERAINLFRRLGVQDEVAALFEQLTPLRSPRLFGALTEVLISQGLSSPPSELRAQDITEVVLGLIDSGEMPEDRLNQLRNIASQFVGGSFRLPQHIPFLTGSISTADAIELYKALGVPLPTEKDFPTPELYQYAYNKN